MSTKILLSFSRNLHSSKISLHFRPKILDLSVIKARENWCRNIFRNALELIVWMDSIEVIKYPIVDHVKLQCTGAVEESLEGSLCISAFHFIFSTRRQNLKDITVSIQVLMYILNVTDFKMKFQ